jgi:hypothetical protein
MGANEMSTAETYLSERQTRSDFYSSRSTDTPHSPTMTSANLEEEISMILPWTYSQFEPLLQLVENWDGYGAAAPDQSSIKTAMNILARLKAVYHAAEPFISPTRTGGVSMEWEGENHYFELDIESASGTYFYKNLKTSDILKGSISADKTPEFTFRRALELSFLK